MNIQGFVLRKPTWVDLLINVITLVAGLWACSVLAERFGFNSNTMHVYLIGSLGSVIAASFGISIRESGWKSLFISVPFSVLLVFIAVLVGWLPK
jgi:hypothetical protein